MSRWRLKWKVFLYLLIFCAFLLILLWLFQTVFLDATYQRIKRGEVVGCANTLAGALDSDSLDAFCDELALRDDCCILVLSESGSVIASADVLRECAIHKISYAEASELLAEARANGGTASRLITPQRPPWMHDPVFPDGFERSLSHFQTTQSLIYVKLAKDASGATYGILINAVISPINATVRTLRIQLIIITFLTLLLAIILALLLARNVARPIERVTKGAQLLADGSYNIHFSSRGFREITELSDTLNTAAVELSKVDELRRELIANVSHDLRTPLSLIYGYAEIMHDFPEEITPELSQTIMDETLRLSSLVGDMLDISLLESGAQFLRPARYNLTEQFDDTISGMNRLLERDGYVISFEHDNDVFVAADRIKVNQAFYNLLINAVHYTGEDKRVVVRQLESEHMVTIEVCDSGLGIAPEDLPCIWDRYYKVDKKHKRAVTGTGLGLSIVKKLIALHGGGYGVRSDVGQGSVFWFSLPLDGEAAAD